MLQMLRKKFIIVDIETIGFKWDAGIVEIGYLFVNNMEIVGSYEQALRPHSASSYDDGTIDWWEKDRNRCIRLQQLGQDAEQIDTKEVLNNIAINWNNFKPEYIFSWHHFDCPILKITFNLYDVELPKILNRFYRWMDAATLAEAYSLRKRTSPHRALQDCETVFELLQRIDTK